MYKYIYKFKPLNTIVLLCRGYIREGDAERRQSPGQLHATLAVFPVWPTRTQAPSNLPDKSFLNLVKSNQIWIVITLIRLICHRTEMEIHLVPHQSEKCEYNSNLIML